MGEHQEEENGTLVFGVSYGNVKLSVRVDRQLFSGESEYQRIDVFESAEFGKFVALDGEIVFSEKMNLSMMKW